MSAQEDPAQTNGLASHWMAVMALASAYFLAYFHRVSPAVLALDLQREFHLTAAALGILSSTYFYPYALLQLPVGSLVDRWGTRPVVTGFIALAGLGSLLFGLAPSFGLAALARGLVGAGVAGVYIPALKAFSSWAGPREFATATGLLMAAGNLGALTATAPLAYAAARMGWRATSLGIGLLSLALTAWLWLALRPEKPGPAQEKGQEGDPPGEGRAKAWELFREPQVLLMGLSLLGKYGPLMSFLGLWGGIYLIEVHGLEKGVADYILMMIALGYTIGGPLFGYLSDRIFKCRRPVLVVGMVLFSFTWLPFLVGRRLSPTLLGLIALSMGITSGGTGALNFAIVKESVPPHLAGTALALVNTLAFAAVTVFQPLTGWAIGQGRYQLAFLLCLAGAALGLKSALRSEEPGHISVEEGVQWKKEQSLTI
ncbi:MAG: MFS transporter [Bacillota bacterium]|nr:MFS transporter [Bacillota bacterium]